MTLTCLRNDGETFGEVLLERDIIIVIPSEEIFYIMDCHGMRFIDAEMLCFPQYKT